MMGPPPPPPSDPVFVDACAVGPVAVRGLGLAEAPLVGVLIMADDGGVGGEV